MKLIRNILTYLLISGIVLPTLPRVSMLAQQSVLPPTVVTKTLMQEPLGDTSEPKMSLFVLNLAEGLTVPADTFSRDAEHVARFQREAEVLASLNHPNIAAICDLQQVKDTRLLVLELVDGETLEDRLKRGAIPLEEALRIAAGLADAIEAAHNTGIIHRDLKPSNIKITRDGAVKVLDFGIAKTTAEDPAAPEFMTPSESGSVLGTAAYMSPEQAGGKDAHRTSDLWSFGCVLYEMLTGCRAFEGETVSSVLAAVLKAEPDWHRLPAHTPDAVCRLLRRCLRKEERLRLHDMADARIEIEEAQTGPKTPVDSVKSKPRHSWLIGISAVLILVIVAAIATLRDFRRVSLEPERRLELAGLPTTAPTSFAISPDGQKIVFEATVEGRSNLWLLPLDSGVARPLAGTESGRTYSPFWSPDSESVAFFAYSEETKLLRVDVQSGSVQTIASVGAAASGGTWSTKWWDLVRRRGDHLPCCRHRWKAVIRTGRW
jgi:serine/threonine protein kinase